MLYKICVKPENVKPWELYIFEDNFKGQVSKALVKVIKTYETETHYKFLVRLLEIYQGAFCKKHFTISINKRHDEFNQRFFRRVMI